MKVTTSLFVMFFCLGAFAKLQLNEPSNVGPLMDVTKVSIDIDTRESKSQRLPIIIWAGEKGGCSISKEVVDKTGLSLVELYTLLKSISEDKNSFGVLYCEKKPNTLTGMEAVEFRFTDDFRKDR